MTLLLRTGNVFFYFLTLEEKMDIIKYVDSGIDDRILRAVTEMGFENMTPIQAAAIPVLLEEKDIIGQAQTGTGKTAAFGIPVLQNINPDSRELQAIILCPTRELAIQAAQEMHRFSKYMHGVRILPVYGGQDINRQIKALRSGVQIIVGTPGRVMDHMRRKTLKFNEVKTVVLDEADEMLNMGFREDMETILKDIPGEHQTALFSATMPQAILDITTQYQNDAVLVKMTERELTVSAISQYFYRVKRQFKLEALSRLLAFYSVKRCLIFCNTKRMVDELADSLKNKGFLADGLHGDLSQKQRDIVMNRFRNGNLEILIATDVAARGIDVDDVEAVFNYDIPDDIEYYVHRIGRTGRAGKQGRAFTFISGREAYKIKEIERICKTTMTERQLPEIEQVTTVKANKLLEEAIRNSLNRDLGSLKQVIEARIDLGESSLLQIAAALLKMQMGDDLKADIEEPKRDKRYGKNQNRDRNDRSKFKERGKSDFSSNGKRGKKDNNKRYRTEGKTNTDLYGQKRKTSEKTRGNKKNKKQD